MQRIDTISTDVIYPLNLFKQITGFHDTAMRTARSNGLRVLHAGGRGFVVGADFRDYLIKVNGPAIGTDGANATGDVYEPEEPADAPATVQLHDRSKVG